MPLQELSNTSGPLSPSLILPSLHAEKHICTTLFYTDAWRTGLFDDVEEEHCLPQRAKTHKPVPIVLLGHA